MCRRRISIFGVLRKKIDITASAGYDYFYDAGIRKIIVTGGSGYIDLFSQDTENTYSPAAHVFSAKGDRTSLLIPSTHELLLAVPRKSGQTAALRMYKLVQ